MSHILPPKHSVLGKYNNSAWKMNKKLVYYRPIALKMKFYGFVKYRKVAVQEKENHNINSPCWEETDMCVEFHLQELSK